VGKTLLGLHFLFQGGLRNEPGILLSLQENRYQLSRIIERFGWSIDDPNVRVIDRSPVDVYIDELVYELLDLAVETGARRIVDDSLNDLQQSGADRARFTEFIYSLVQRCSHLGVSLMFTSEVVELFHVTRLGDSAISHMADNVVLLQYVQDGPQMKRALTIVKSRRSNTSNTTREFRIASSGFTLGEPINTR
jgi:circadian clock protein KaiC